MTIQDFQALLAALTGYKIGVRHLSGSMKAYIRFKPLKSGGIYPEYTKEHIKVVEALALRDRFITDYSIDVNIKNFQI